LQDPSILVTRVLRAERDRETEREKARVRQRDSAPILNFLFAVLEKL
jgi:hypothetical protein